MHTARITMIRNDTILILVTYLINSGAYQLQQTHQCNKSNYTIILCLTYRSFYHHCRSK